MADTSNYKMTLPSYTSSADLKVLNENFKTIDSGISPFYVATLNSRNVYKITTGLKLTSLKDGFSIKVAIPSDSDITYTYMKLIVDDCGEMLIKKPNGRNLVNFKANGVYNLTYYNSVFILVSGGDESDTTNVGSDGSNVLEPHTFIGSDGEIHTGTISNNGTKVKQLAINETYTLGKGYYDSITVNQNVTTKASQTYIPSRSNQIIYANQYLNGNQTIKGDSNLLAENIKEGVSLFGTLGTCTIQSMGGVKMESGNSAISYSEYGSNPYYNAYLNINPSFTPKLVIMYPNFDYNRCQTLLITNLFDKNKIYRQEWQGTSSDTTKRQIGTSIIDYDEELMKKIHLGKTRYNSDMSVPWIALG